MMRTLFNQIKDIKVEKIILYGSRITGEELKNSDLDLIVVSSDFSGLKFTDRNNLLSPYLEAWKLNFPIEVLCYTPEELEEKAQRIGLVKEAIENGIVITLDDES